MLDKQLDFLPLLIVCQPGNNEPNAHVVHRKSAIWTNNLCGSNRNMLP